MKHFIFLSLLSMTFSIFADVTLKNSACTIAQATREGVEFKITATCTCQGKSAQGEAKSPNPGRALPIAQSRARRSLSMYFSKGSIIDCNSKSEAPVAKVVEASAAQVAPSEPPAVEVSSAPVVVIEPSPEPTVDLESELTRKCPNGVRERQYDGKTYLFCNEQSDSRGPLMSADGKFFVKNDSGIFELFDRQKEKIKSDQPSQTNLSVAASTEKIMSPLNEEPPKKEKSILELVNLCKEPSVDNGSCYELMDINPKFADMIHKLNEGFKKREALIVENPDYEGNLSNRDNFELAQKLAELEYLDEKKVFSEFCEDSKGTALCLADTELAVLEDDRNFKKCLNERIAQIEIKNPGNAQYERGAFARTHSEDWKSGKNCKELLARDVKTFNLDKFYDTDIEFRDFDPQTCKWFSDLPRRVIRGAVKSCQGDKKAEACVGYVVCERQSDKSKFVRQSTCSKNNCTQDRAVACTVEKNFSSKTFKPKQKLKSSTPETGARKE